MSTKYFWNDEQFVTEKTKDVKVKGEEKANQLPKNNTKSILECDANDLKKKGHIHK